MDKVHGCMHSGGEDSQVSPDATGEKHGRGGACEGGRLLESQLNTSRASGRKLQRRGRLGYGDIRGCIMAQIAPSAKTWHRSGVSGRLSGREREELELSRMRGIRASGSEGMQRNAGGALMHGGVPEWHIPSAGGSTGGFLNREG